jgi:hypothetical protein
MYIFYANRLMKRFLFTTTLTLIIFNVYAQIGPSRVNRRETKALVVINDKKITQPLVLKLIDPEDIEDVKVFNSGDSMKKYGEDGKNGSIVLTLKRKAKMLTLNQAFKKFRISKNNRALELYLNEEKILFRDSFLASKDWISNIELMDGPTKNIAEEKYLRIVVVNRPGRKL